MPTFCNSVDFEFGNVLTRLVVYERAAVAPRLYKLRDLRAYLSHTGTGCIEEGVMKKRNRCIISPELHRVCEFE